MSDIKHYKLILLIYIIYFNRFVVFLLSTYITFNFNSMMG